MTFLEEICEKKKEEIDHLYKESGIDTLKEKASERVAVEPPFFLSQSIRNDEKLSLIAEIKKASPSKGLIYKEGFEPTQLAKDFEKNGATALSILTEEHFFLGSAQNITNVKKICELPILRKDFILDEIQIYESKVLGAHAILLIKALLDTTQCKRYIEIAESLSLDVILELHTDEELEDSASLTPTCVGINNRNLKTFETDTQQAIRLLPNLSQTFTKSMKIAESGYSTKNQLQELQKVGYDAVLIGEGLSKNKALNL